jgi:hypothetical protein
MLLIGITALSKVCALPHSATYSTKCTINRISAGSTMPTAIIFLYSRYATRRSMSTIVCRTARNEYAPATGSAGRAGYPRGCAAVGDLVRREIQASEEVPQSHGMLPALAVSAR